MTRNILDEAHIHPAARETIAKNHADTVREVQVAVASNDVVVIGMTQNPFPKKARKALDAAGVPYKYLTYGQLPWRLAASRRFENLDRMADVPDGVFERGVLVGGADDLTLLIASSELTRMLAGKPGPRRKE